MENAYGLAAAFTADDPENGTVAWSLAGSDGSQHGSGLGTFGRISGLEGERRRMRNLARPVRPPSPRAKWFRGARFTAWLSVVALVVVAALLTPVAGVKDRETNEVSAAVIPGTDRPTLQGFVLDRTADGAEVYTDELRAYQGLPNHTAVNHSVGQYVDGMAHSHLLSDHAPDQG